MDGLDGRIIFQPMPALNLGKKDNFTNQPMKEVVLFTNEIVYCSTLGQSAPFTTSIHINGVN